MKEVNRQGLRLKALSYSTQYREARPYCGVQLHCLTHKHKRMSNYLFIITLSFILVQTTLHVSSSHYIDIHALSPASRQICLFQGGLLLLGKRPVRVTLSLTPLFSTKSFHEFAGLLSSSRRFA